MVIFKASGLKQDRSCFNNEVYWSLEYRWLGIAELKGTLFPYLLLILDAVFHIHPNIQNPDDLNPVFTQLKVNHESTRLTAWNADPETINAGTTA